MANLVVLFACRIKNSRIDDNLFDFGCVNSGGVEFLFPSSNFYGSEKLGMICKRAVGTRPPLI